MSQPSPGFWFRPAGCDCLYNPHGFLEQECWQCEEEARATRTPPPRSPAEEDARWLNCDAT
jgi:hypothetical protein